MIETCHREILDSILGPIGWVSYSINPSTAKYYISHLKSRPKLVVSSRKWAPDSATSQANSSISLSLPAALLILYIFQ